MEEKKPSLWDKTKNWIMGITTLVVAGGGTAYVVNEISQDDHNKNKTEKWVDPKTGRLTGFDIVQEKDRFTAYDEQGKEIGKLDSHQIVNKDDAKTEEKGESTGHYVRLNRHGQPIIYDADGDSVGVVKARRETGLPIIPVIKREKTEQEQAQEFADKIRHNTSMARGEDVAFPTADKNADKVEEHQMSKGASIGYGKYKDTENDHYAYSGTKEDLQAKAQKKLADAIVERILFGKHKKVTLADVRAKSENLQHKKNGTDTPAPQPNAAEDQNREAVLPKQPQIKSIRSKGGRKGGEPLGA